MKTHYAAVAVLCAMAVLCSSAAVLLATDADADASVFEGYYKNQLTSSQKAIYEAMVGLSADVAVNDDGAGGYYIEVTVPSNSDHDALLKDAERAWQATKLEASADNKWSFWTWGLTDAKPSITVPDDTHIRVSVASQFSGGFSSAVAAVTAAVDAIEISGSTDAEKVRNINSKLTSSTYVYVASNADHVYANTLYSVASDNLADGKAYMTSFAYSALFKALCTKYGVSCTQVYGLYGNDGIAYAWNIVLMDGRSYAADSATNSTSGNKELWLGSGLYTTDGTDPFGKVHEAFPYSVAAGLTYDFESETLNNNEYSWPEDTSILAKLVEYAPWILVGIICAVVSVALIVMAKRGD